MHALEVIVARNSRAAGQELAHADANGDTETASRILRAALLDEITASTSFMEGYLEVVDGDPSHPYYGEPR